MVLWARPAAPRGPPQPATRPTLALGCVGHGPTSNGHTAVHTRRPRRAPNAISRPNRPNRDFAAAAGRLRRSAAARHAACACSTVRGARLDAVGSIPVQFRSPHTVRKRAGAAGTRVGSVEVGFFGVDFSVWLDAPRAAGPGANVSDFDPSLRRREMLLRRRRSERSELKSPRARPTLTRAVPQVTARAAPCRRELGEQMRINALRESNRKSHVEDRRRPAALQAGEWECRWERGRTSRGSRGGFGGAPRVQHSPPWTSRGRRSGR